MIFDIVLTNDSVTYRYSCSPNSQIEKWYLNGEMSIGIFASQDIPAGAEISYDYNFSSFSGAQKQKCRCGASNCRGYIGERISKNKEPASVPNGHSSGGRTGKKVDGRKRKAGRRKVRQLVLDDTSIRRVRDHSVHTDPLHLLSYSLPPLHYIVERPRGELGAPCSNANCEADPTTPIRQAQGQDGSHSLHQVVPVPKYPSCRVQGETRHDPHAACFPKSCCLLKHPFCVGTVKIVYQVRTDQVAKFPRICVSIMAGSSTSMPQTKS